MSKGESETRMNAVAMSYRLRVLICSTLCSKQVAAAEHIKSSIPGNRVGLKLNGPPSPAFLAALGRNRAKCRCSWSTADSVKR